jgi:hypothetical protein
MKNVLVCKNCKYENPYYVWICNNCNSYLRERIFNIDLWNVLGLLIYEPKKGYGIIIQSEHKNFILPIFLFASIKLFIDSMFIALLTYKNEPFLGNVIIHFLIIFSTLLAMVLIFVLVLTLLNNFLGLNTRFRDNLSILVYSLIPHVFALILLFTVELTVFGGSLFSNNPSPFSVKEFLAYTFLAFEGIIVVWGIILGINAVYSQSKNILYSIITGTIFNLVIYFSLYINSIYLFK